MSELGNIGLQSLSEGEINFEILRVEVDEPHHTVRPDLVVDNLAALVDIMLSEH